eukprot:6177605-Pleurochrysis_carterae.AAC.1
MHTHASTGLCTHARTHARTHTPVSVPTSLPALPPMRVRLPRLRVCLAQPIAALPRLLTLGSRLQRGLARHRERPFDTRASGGRISVGDCRRRSPRPRARVPAPKVGRAGA